MVRFLLSLFSVVVLASEGVLSPLADNQNPVVPLPTPVVVSKPSVSFAQLIIAPAVLGAQTERVPHPSPAEALAQAGPTSTPKPVISKRLTIAVLGDSMVDTLGPGVPALASRLKNLFPTTAFTILNYGVGATNIEYGIQRLTNDYDYLGNHIASLVSQKPDIVVVESFGYNPFSEDEGALDHHWLSMAKVVDTLKAQLSGVKIIFAATIAPNANVFGDGAPGLSFSAEDKQKRVTNIKRYIENTINFAHSQHYPLADAYHASLGKDGNGALSYINPGDHIHYSDAGRSLMGQKMADAILKILQ